MDITYYAFAFFVFILLVILIWFYGRVTRKKADPGSQEKEQRLFRLYQNIEDMMGGFEEYAESAKKDISEGLDKLQSMLSETKSAPWQPVKQPEYVAQPEHVAQPGYVTQPEYVKQPEHAQKPETPAINPQDESKLKTEERISLLVQRGMNKGEIAKKLGLSIREVSLIMDIRKIANADDLVLKN
jgi:hypothetical protein